MAQRKKPVKKERVGDPEDVPARDGGIVKTETGRFYAYIKTGWDDINDRQQVLGEIVAEGFTKNDCVSELLDRHAELYRYTRKLIDDIEEFRVQNEERFDKLLYGKQVIFNHDTNDYQIWHP